MQGRGLGIPVAAIEIVAVLGYARKVDNAEQRAVARPVGIIRCRLSEVVKSGPYELAYAVGKVLMLDEIIFRKIGPSAVFHIVA